ncbi:MAG: polysaccharide biosynthesis tyrosine autokinase [Alistipes sp.]|nr:polysaccharide biosynthesis tyrosine autokinase [Alistipes sp.]
MTDMMETNERSEINNSTFSIQEFIELVLRNWYWFIVSVAICGAVALYYLASTPKTYVRTATVVVKDTRKGSGSEITAFNDVLGGIGRRSVDNEIHIFQSRRVMEQVVDKYNLDTRYRAKEGLRVVDMYGRAPITIEFVDAKPSEVVSFKYSIGEDNTITFTEFKDNEGYSVKAQIGEVVATPFGNIVTAATPYFEHNRDKVIGVTQYPLNDITETYRKRLNCAIVDKMASVITLSMVDEVPQRAEHILNGVIEAYDMDAIADKQAVSNLTEKFILERLQTLGEELNDADVDIASFKQDNSLYSPSQEASIRAEETAKLKESALSLEANMEMTTYLLNYLRDSDKTDSLIPASAVTISGVSSGLATQIEQYNKSLLEYKRLLAASSTTNPTIIDLGNQIAGLHSAVIASLESHIETLKLRIEQINREQQVVDKRMQKSPTMEMELLSKARQQKVKEELYIYLLTKLEENALSEATAESNARVIDHAYGSNIPVSPRSTIILLFSLIMGVCIPLAILYIREIMNTSVRSRRDLDAVLTIPFLGDVPQHNGKMGNGIVVREDSRDALSESFRMLRTNLSFMSVNNKIQVMMFTSSIPHSGKSFVSSNLAYTLASSGKRVVIVDLDLRLRTLSKTMGQSNNRRGITSYLSGKIESYEDIITPSEESPNLDIIYAGPKPPNPTDMLMSERMDQLVESLRSKYDYIIFDSVPAIAIADALVLDRLVDLTVYIIRQGNLDRRDLPEIEMLYREKKFRNMCTILNSSTHSNNKYGYGYYDTRDNQSRLNKFWSKIKGNKR